MRIFIKILTTLAILTSVLAGYLISDGQKALAFKCLVLAFIFYVLDAILFIVRHLQKTPYEPQRLFKRPPRRKPSPKDPIKSSVPLPDNPKLREAVIRLRALSEHLPKDDLSETYVNDYHALLDVAGAELQEDLSGFRIPESKLVRHLASVEWENPNTGWRVTDSKELFCPPHVFRIALRGALDFIESCPPPKAVTSAEKPKELKAKTATPEPQTAQLQTTAATQAAEVYKPDETDIKILDLIGQGSAWESQIGDTLKLNHLEVGLRIRKLEDHGYVELVRPPNRAPYHQLTDEGIEFLGDRPIYTIPHPSRHDIIDDQKTTTPPEPAKFYQPDRTTVDILKEIHKGNGYEVEIAVALELNPTTVAIRLADLSQHDYIKLHPMDSRAGYYILAPKGDEFLNKPDYRGIPHPSGRLDELSERLLTLLGEPNCKPEPSHLGAVLNIHPVRVRVLLSKLAERGLVVHSFYNSRTGEPGFSLTNPGREYLVNYNLIP